MMQISNVYLRELEMQILSDRNKIQIHTLEGLTINDMLVQQRRPSLIQRLAKHIRQRWSRQNTQGQVSQQPMTVLSVD
jgi:hypothetical protein